MWKIYCDDYLLHDDRLSLKVYHPRLEMELNKTGSFTFSIDTDHPYYSVIHRMKSIITVYQDDYLLFRGRVLEDELGFHNERQVSCEGELAFLLDSIQRPYESTGSIKQFLQQILIRHNEQVETHKQFILGEVTVKDSNDYINRSDTDYSTSLDAITNKLIGTHGGFLWVRHEEDGNYLDYVDDFNVPSTQSIEFAKNLIDIHRENKADELCTVLIPVGKEGLTIASVNDGNDYIENESAISAYGRIVKVQKWDDVELPENLLEKAQEYLADNSSPLTTLEITSADLASIEDVNPFRLGTKVRVNARPQGLEDEIFLVQKLSIDLLNPASNRLVLGNTTKLIESHIEKLMQTKKQVSAVQKTTSS
ncbi:MAG: phage tail protein, partial [Holdemanella sp.]|nr:phage tail protein [Holdemanella sp.]